MFILNQFLSGTLWDLFFTIMGIFGQLAAKWRFNINFTLKVDSILYYNFFTVNKSFYYVGSIFLGKFPKYYLQVSSFSTIGGHWSFSKIHKLPKYATYHLLKLVSLFCDENNFKAWQQGILEIKFYSL